MNTGKEEEATLVAQAVPAVIEGAKKAQDMEKKLTAEGDKKLEDTEKLAQEQIAKAQQAIGLQGTPVQIAQQQSLIAAAAQYFAASLISMVVLQLGVFSKIFTFIPFLQTITILSYFVSLLIVQFCPNAVNKGPRNFGLFLLHSCSKIMLLLYVTLWFEEIKPELIELVFGIIIVYILFEIRKGINENQEDIAITVKKQFIPIIVVSAIVSAFLGLLTRSNLLITGLLILLGSLYAYYVLLALQRFSQHVYLQENKNDLYLGAAQFDADLFLMCKLVGFHCLKRQENGTYLPNVDIEEQKETNQPAQQQQDNI